MVDEGTEQELERQLASKGYRLTLPRKLVLESLRAAPCHADANWVYDQVRKQLPGVSLGTIYRTLNVLVEAGLIRMLHCGDRHARYDAHLQPHDHAICQDCGALVEAEIFRGQGTAKATGFAIWGHHLDFYGLCPACQAKRAQRESEGP